MFQGAMAAALAALAAVGGAMTGADAPPPATSTDAPAWIEGYWVSEEGGRTTSEHWLRVHPRLLVGTAATREGDEPRFTEQFYVLATPAGVEYVVTPTGQAATTFRLVSSGTTAAGTQRAVFANPAHDFPRRIVYERGEDPAGPWLRTRIEGPKGGPPPREWRWRRREAPAVPAPLVARATVAAPPAAVYAAFTTRAGVRTFFAPDGLVEARPGGAYEVWFAPDQPAGQRGSDSCRVVALEPDRRLAVTWNFPPSLAPIRPAHAFVSVAFAPAEGGAATAVTITHTGFRAGAIWEQGRAYFERAWGVVLDRLRRRFTAGPVDWEAE